MSTKDDEPQTPNDTHSLPKAQKLRSRSPKRRDSNRSFNSGNSKNSQLSNESNLSESSTTSTRLNRSGSHSDLSRSQKRNMRRRMKKTNSDLEFLAKKPSHHDMLNQNTDEPLKASTSSLERSDSFVRMVGRTTMTALFDEMRRETYVQQLPSHLELMLNKQNLSHLITGCFDEGTFKIRITKKEPSHGTANIRVEQLGEHPNKEKAKKKPLRKLEVMDPKNNKLVNTMHLQVLHSTSHSAVGGVLKGTVLFEFKVARGTLNTSFLITMDRSGPGNPIYFVDISKKEEENRSQRRDRNSISSGINHFLRSSTRVSSPSISEKEKEPEWVIKAPLDPKGHLIPKKRRDEMLKKIPDWKIFVIPNSLKINKVWGPNLKEEEEKILNVVSARSVSTYPVILGQRQADPICDSWCLELSTGQIVFSIADGCGWGSGPRNSSFFASQFFVNSMVRHMPAIQKVADAAHYLIDTFESAHAGIVKDRNLDDVFLCGTTTLLGGICLPLIKKKKKNDSRKKWGFVGLNIGDCKCFKFDVQNNKIVDMNFGNRSEVNDPKDPGGRIGPHLEGGMPDWRNLSFFSTKCYSGDIFILCTDGVHDNLDPELLGMTPEQAGHPIPNLKSWAEAEKLYPKETQDLRSQVLCNNMLQKLKDTRSPSKITNVLIEWAMQLTKPSREFLEENNERLPDDYSKYPGKIDHTSCLVFQIP